MWVIKASQLRPLLCSYFAICVNQLFLPFFIISMMSRLNFVKSIWG